jgi:hypothetical protein
MYLTFSLAVLSFWGRLYQLLAFPVAVLVGSAVWFFGGYWDHKDSLKEKKKKREVPSGVFMEIFPKIPPGVLPACVGVFILVAYSMSQIFSRNWIGVLLPSAGVVFEIWHLTHRWQLKSAQGNPPVQGTLQR